MTNARMLIGLLLALLTISVAAQSPREIWGISTAPQGDGTRAYVDGHQVIGSIFQVVQNPMFDAQSVVATADGAYLVIPTQGGGGSQNLAYVLPPSWLVNRGWQVIRLGSSGEVLWSQYIRRRTQAAAPVLNNLFDYVTEPRLLQTRLTASGGIAVLTDSSLHVFDASGTATFSGDFSTSMCRPAVEDFSYPTEQFFNDEGLLVLAYDMESTSQLRACAIDLDGVELDRVVSTATAMEVGDYRSGFGFLVKEGDWNSGVWSNITLSLRGQAGPRWSLPATEPYWLQPSQAISPTGETWLLLAGGYSKIRLDGSIAWQIAPTEFLETNSLAWLAGDRQLLRSNDSTTLRVLQSDGQTAWATTLGPLSGNGLDVVWQVGADSLGAFGYRADNHSGRVLRLQLTDGTIVSDTTMNWSTENRQVAFGPFAADRAVAVSPGTTTAYWERAANLPCDLPGYCADSASFAKPEIALYSTGSGAWLGGPAANLGYPLAAHPLERRPTPRLTYEDEQLAGMFHTQYVYDGLRNLAQVQRVGMQGDIAWTRSLGFAQHDAAQAAVYDNSGGVYVSAARRGAPSNAAPAKLWKLARADGTLLWEIDLPFVPQQLRPLLSATSGLDICGVSYAPHHLICVSPAGVLTRSIMVPNVPANARLESVGSVIWQGEQQIRVRVMPAAESFSDRFEFAGVSDDGQLQSHFQQIFAPVTPAQRLRADAFDAASGVATAVLYHNTTGFGRPQSLQVARFDSAGARLWQTEIEIPMRTMLDEGESTAVAVSQQGDVFVSLHPYAANTHFPTTLCQLTASGVTMTCTDAPREGRIVSLFSVDDGPGVWVWQRAYLGANTGPVGMYLYPFAATGFGPAVLSVGSHSALTFDSDFLYEGRGYFMLATNGTGSNRASGDTRLLAIQFTDLPLFADGFE